MQCLKEWRKLWKSASWPWTVWLTCGQSKQAGSLRGKGSDSKSVRYFCTFTAFLIFIVKFGRSYDACWIRLVTLCAGIVLGNINLHSGLLQWRSKLHFLNKKYGQPLTVCSQGLQFSRVSQTACNLKFNPMRFQAEQSLEQKLTLRKEVIFCITVVEHVNSFLRCLLKGQYLQYVSAGLSSLRDYIQIYCKIIAFPLTEHLGNAVGSCSTGELCSGCLPQLCTCLAMLGIVFRSQEFKTQTGDTTSTECFAWSNSVWKPTERGRWDLPSVERERSSGIFSTSTMLKVTRETWVSGALNRIYTHFKYSFKVCLHFFVLLHMLKKLEVWLYFLNNSE